MRMGDTHIGGTAAGGPSSGWELDIDTKGSEAAAELEQRGTWPASKAAEVQHRSPWARWGGRSRRPMTQKEGSVCHGSERLSQDAAGAIRMRMALLLPLGLDGAPAVAVSRCCPKLGRAVLARGEQAEQYSSAVGCGSGIADGAGLGVLGCQWPGGRVCT